MVHGPGPWGGPWTRSMFCVRPDLNVDIHVQSILTVVLKKDKNFSDTNT